MSQYVNQITDCIELHMHNNVNRIDIIELQMHNNVDRITDYYDSTVQIM